MATLAVYQKKIVNQLSKTEGLATCLVIGCGKSQLIGQLYSELGLKAVDLLDYRQDNLDFQRSLLADSQLELGFYKVDLQRRDWSAALDKVYDCIICLEVIEHLDCPDMVLAELPQLLAEKGRAVLSVPTWLTEKIMKALNPRYMDCEGGQSGHRQVFTRTSFQKAVSAAGLKPVYSSRYQSGYVPAQILLNLFNVAIDDDTGELVETNPLKRIVAKIAAKIVRTGDLTGLVYLFDPLLGRSYVVVVERER